MPNTTDDPAHRPDAAADAGDGTRTPDRLRPVFWTSLLSLFMLAAGWALITPYDGAYDEHDHVVRAAGVVRGQVLVQPGDARNGRFQSVPRSLVPPHYDCLRGKPNPATCLGTPPDDRARTDVQTRAGHYNPVYYAVVGLPLAALPTMTGVLLARLINALIGSTLLALAVVTVWPVRRYRFLLLAVLLSAAPIVVSLNGLVNPSGIEISAAALLWTALCRLLTAAGPDGTAAAPDGTAAAPDGTDGTGGADDRRLVLLCGVAATTTALIRPAGLVVLAAVVALAVVALGSRRRVRSLLSRRDVRRVTAVTAAAAVLVIGWAVAASVGSYGTEAAVDGRSWAAIVRGIVFSRMDYWVRQAVGVFAYADVALPVWIVALWTAVQGMVVLTGFALARRRHAYTIVAIPVLCLGTGALAELATARFIGAFVQSRYFLPVWIGMFVLAALAVPAGTVTERTVRRVHLLFAAVWASAMISGLYLTLRRFKYGAVVDTSGAGPVPWSPMTGDFLAFGVTTVGVVLMWWVVRRYLATTGPA